MRYGTDTFLPRMLYGKILRSPWPHAKILNIDTSAAVKVPGLKGIFTGEDVPHRKYGDTLADEHVLAWDKARFIGDEIAAAVAMDEDAAIEALEALRVDYQPLPAVFSPEEAIKPGASLIHDDFPGNLAYRYEISRGDIDSGLAKADAVVEGDFVTGLSHQGYLEPTSCVASYDGGRITLWFSAQSPYRDKGWVSDALGLTRDKVRIIQTCVGGAFGGKYGQRLPIICAFLAMKMGRPVRLDNSREEEFLAGHPRVGTKIWMRLGVKSDGSLVSKEAKVLGDNGAYTGPACRILVNTHRCDNLYRIGNIKNEGMLIYTNKAKTGAFRGFGGPQGAFALESLLDEAAEKINMDPLELRKRNAIRPGEVSVHGYKPISCGLTECLETAAERIGWRRKRADRQSDGEVRKGIGLGALIHVSGSKNSPNFYGSQALVRITREGKAIVITGEADIGQGSNTIFAQIAAEELGIPFEDVRVEIGVDTDLSPLAIGTFSDRLTTVAGNAVKLAATDAKKQITDFAGEMLEVAPVDLEMNDGKVMVKGVPGKAVALEEIAEYAATRPGGGLILGKGIYDPPSERADPKTLYGNCSTAYAFGAQAVEVEVNVKTGEIKVVKVITVHDAGKVINPLLATGQLEGAVSQALGFALFEEMKYQDGSLINPSFTGYNQTRSTAMPEVEIHFVQTYEPSGPFGAKALAEPAIVPTAGAVANAVYHATGIRLKKVPMAAEELLDALEKL